MKILIFQINQLQTTFLFELLTLKEIKGLQSQSHTIQDFSEFFQFNSLVLKKVQLLNNIKFNLEKRPNRLTSLNLAYLLSLSKKMPEKLDLSKKCLPHFLNASQGILWKPSFNFRNAM